MPEFALASEYGDTLVHADAGIDVYSERLDAETADQIAGLFVERGQILDPAHALGGDDGRTGIVAQIAFR